jgi:hypothetical protein
VSTTSVPVFIRRWMQGMHKKCNEIKVKIYFGKKQVGKYSYRLCVLKVTVPHKVLIYIEHHSVCPLVGIGTPPPL